MFNCIKIFVRLLIAYADNRGCQQITENVDVVQIQISIVSVAEFFYLCVSKKKHFSTFVFEQYFSLLCESSIIWEILLGFDVTIWQKNWQRFADKLSEILKMLYKYTSSQKFKFIRISVLAI